MVLETAKPHTSQNSKVNGHSFSSSDIFFEKNLFKRMNPRFLFVFLVILALASFSTAEATARDLKKSDASDGPLTSNPEPDSKSTNIEGSGKGWVGHDTSSTSSDKETSSEQGREGKVDGSGSSFVGFGQGLHRHQDHQEWVSHQVGLEVLQVKVDALLVLCSLILILFLGSATLTVIKRSRKDLKPKPVSHQEHYCALGKACNAVGLMGGPGSCADCESALVQLRGSCEKCCSKVHKVAEAAQNKAKDVAQDVRKKTESQIDSLLAPAVERALLRIENEK